MNSIIDATGLYPALLMSADLGWITRDQRFKLDEKQRMILKRFSKVMMISFNKFLKGLHRNLVRQTATELSSKHAQKEFWEIAPSQ